MNKINLKKVAVVAVVGLAALGPVALRGASAFAQTPPSAAVEVAEPAATGPDTDTVNEQVGDQTAADGVAEAPEVKGADTDTVNEQVGDQNAPETPGGARSPGSAWCARGS